MVNPRPDADHFIEPLRAAAKAVASGALADGALQLQAITPPAFEVAPRPTLNATARVAIWRRDSFCCRYCGVRTIPECVLRLLGLVFPDLFPWHPNWRGGHTHPAIPLLSAEVDHIEPGSRGGPWLAAENLVVTCPRCNSVKSDYTLEELGWTLLDVAHPEWDGLTRWHRPLWEAAGRPGHQRRWLRAFET